MESSAVSGFFRVVKRPQTWLNVLFQWLAFPLGLFYFIFLVVGLSLGLGLLVVWVGIPILLVVAGAWWLFGSFERIQAQYLLQADVGPAPRSWETVDGVWAKLKAHFANGATWRDLAYLMAKLPFGIVSFTLSVTAVAVVAWLAAFPAAWYWDFHLITWDSTGTVGSSTGQGYTPTWWMAILAVPAAILAFFVFLHVLNGWGWVCARWAELLFGKASTQPASAGAGPAPLVSTPPATSMAQPAPLVSTPPVQPTPPAQPAPLVSTPPAQPAPQPAPQAETEAPQPPAQPVVPPAPYMPPAQPVVQPPRHDVQERNP